MNAEKERTLAELARRNPFWICLIVFLVLGCDYSFRLANLIEQRSQLRQAELMQAQNAGALAQAQRLEGQLEALSLDLLQLAKTNAAAKQIVQDFNIQWNPGPAAAAPVRPAGSQPKSNAQPK